MAAYNTEALIDEVLDLAKDSSIPRSRVLTYLQRTQDKVLGHNRFKFSEDSLIETLSTDSTTYQYDCEQQQIVQVVLTHADFSDPIRPKYLSPNDFFARFPMPDTNEAGTPSFYTDYGDELYWNCPLDRAYTLGMRFITASCRLTDTDSSVPGIPEAFGDLLVKGALARVEEYRENHDIAAVYRREAEEIHEDLLGRFSQRTTGAGKARTTRVRVVRR